MSHQHQMEVDGEDCSESMLLEIQGEKDQGVLRIPVNFQDIGDDQIMVRIDPALPELIKESVPGRPAHLFLAAEEIQGIVKASGKVAWLKDTASGHYQIMALELSEGDEVLKKILNRHNPHSLNDIKELWDQWDQISGSFDRPPLNYHVALVLTVGGIVLNLAGPKSLIMVSYLLMLLGGLVAGIKNLWPLQWKSVRFF